MKTKNETIEQLTTSPGVKNQLDITAPQHVQIVIRNDGKVIWINVDGICKLRCCRIGVLELEDQRI